MYIIKLRVNIQVFIVIVPKVNLKKNKLIITKERSNFLYADIW